MLPTFEPQAIAKGVAVAKQVRRTQPIAINQSTQAWTITNSFRAAYVTWDRTKNISRSRLETEREFDYSEFPLEQFK